MREVAPRSRAGGCRAFTDAWVLKTPRLGLLGAGFPRPGAAGPGSFFSDLRQLGGGALSSTREPLAREETVALSGETRLAGGLPSFQGSLAGRLFPLSACIDSGISFLSFRGGTSTSRRERRGHGWTLAGDRGYDAPARATAGQRPPVLLLARGMWGS